MLPGRRNLLRLSGARDVFCVLPRPGSGVVTGMGTSGLRQGSPQGPTGSPGRRWVPRPSVQRPRGTAGQEGTDHHEQLQRDTPAEPQQREGADGDSGDGLAGPQELQLEGDGSVQVHAGVILHQLHKDRPAPARGEEQLWALGQHQPRALVPLLRRTTDPLTL